MRNLRQLVWSAMLIPGVACARSVDSSAAIAAVFFYALLMATLAAGFVLIELPVTAERRGTWFGYCMGALLAIGILVGVLDMRGGAFAAVLIIVVGGAALMGLAAIVAALLRSGIDDPALRSVLLTGLAVLVAVLGTGAAIAFLRDGGALVFGPLSAAPFAAWAMAARRTRDAEQAP